jgi:hypothetical protein
METNTNHGPATAVASGEHRKRCPECRKLHNEDGAFCSAKCLKRDDNRGPN